MHPVFAPFLARSILELSCTALLARLDPFRVLTLAELQSHATYEAGKKVAAAIQWQGDVLAEAKQDLWVQDRRAEQMSRALLGDYLGAIVWQPAFQSFVDVAAARGEVGPRTAELQRYQLHEFVPRIRTGAASTYSSASKGIHHEFVLPRSSYYDEPTLKVMIEDAIHISADLGVVANCCDHLAFKVTPDNALDLYESIP